MKILEANFSDLDFFDASLRGPKFTDSTTLALFVKNLGLMPSHSLNQSSELMLIDGCELNFEGVVSSERVIREYVGNPDKGKFKDLQKISDGSFPESNRKIRRYEFEGKLECPLAWVDTWIIDAERCILIFPTK